MGAPDAKTPTEAAHRPRTVPQPTPESQPFWDACARNELVFQRCHSCARYWFPPSNRCQHCWSTDRAWTSVSGRGELYTFTVFHRAYAPELVERLPYVVGVVELEEGPRLVTNIVDCEPGHVRVGMPVEVTFRDITEGVRLHAFRPRADSHTTRGGGVCSTPTERPEEPWPESYR